MLAASIFSSSPRVWTPFVLAAITAGLCGHLGEAFCSSPRQQLLLQQPRPLSTRSTATATRPMSSSSLSSSRQTSNDEKTSEASRQNVFGLASDAVTGAAFSLLHAFDDCGIQDSSKNLRVLWVRALLHQRGLIDDEVAATFLPPTTRGLVTTSGGASLFEPILKFTEWIQARTDFIDTALEHFLSSSACTDPETGEARECNVVLFGAGYDTRALRYRHAHDDKIRFIEVDLPDVVEGKTKLYQKFQREQDPEWDLETHGSRLVPLDLNSCGDGDPPVSLVETLREQGGLRRNVPTFFVWEAVLFYVNEGAVRNIMQELFDFAKEGGNGNDSAMAETMLCFTDSLKPFVNVPFSNEARIFFDKDGDMDLLEHRSRWGGAVHFALAASRRERNGKDDQQDDNNKDEKTKKATESTPKATTASTVHAFSSSKDQAPNFSGAIAKHVSGRVGGIVNSYTPTQANNKNILTNPSFENVWYAVAYPWQIDGYATPLDAAVGRRPDNPQKPFATRLWGEPLVIYRDTNDELVAMADVCPHRSVPLSIGTYENGELACMYHGWKFGAKGDCVDVPTLRNVDEEGKLINDKNKETAFLASVNKANCGNLRAVVEHEGLVYVWRGNVLEADVSLLPSRRKGDMETVPIDTVLDYSVDYSYIVENNLDSPHLFYLHDGSVPPIESIGMLNSNLPKLRLTAFTDDCGMGHLGRLGNDRPKKLLRFDPPNIVRHGGVSGFEEEFHMCPIAPHRTRVFLRQHLPRGPILSTITSFPFVKPLLTVLVNNWNYHIALEDACVMQGQANRIEDWGAPRMVVGGLGDDLIKRFWKWRSQAHEALAKNAQGDQDEESISSPYYVDFLRNGGELAGKKKKGSGLTGIPTGTSFGDDPAVVSRVREDARLRNTPLVTDNQAVDSSTGNAIGSWGIKQAYLQNTPPANFPPMNYGQYKELLVFDTFVKNLFARKGEVCPPEDDQRQPPSDNDDGSKRTQKKEKGFVPGITKGEPEVQPAYVSISSFATNQTAASTSV